MWNSTLNANQSVDRLSVNMSLLAAVDIEHPIGRDLLRVVAAVVSII